MSSTYLSFSNFKDQSAPQDRMFQKICCLLIALYIFNGAFSQERGNIVIPFKKTVANPLKGDSGRRKAAIVVGISDYSSNKLTLKYAYNDARLMYDYLTGIQQLPKENVQILPDSLATSGRIYNAILDMMKWLTAGDELMLYFAGHGDVQTVADFDEAFFLAWDASDSRNYHGTSGTLKMTDLELYTNRLASIKKVKVTLIMDACHAGFDLYKDGVLKAQDNISGSFNNINKFLGCAVNEFSYEADSVGHGLFSWYLVQGMMGLADKESDNIVTYAELRNYTQQKVSTATRGKQNPVIQTKKESDAFALVTADMRGNALNYFSKKSYTNLLASRGNAKSISLPETDLQVWIDLYNRFLLKEQLYELDSSCITVLTGLNKIKTEEAQSLKWSLQQHLAEVLETRSQLVLNEYLKGKSELPASSIFFTAGKEATLADSLLPTDDPRKKSNQVMAAFHKAFSYIRYDHFEKYPEAEFLLRNAIRLEDRAAYLYVTMGYLMQYQHKYDSAIYFVQKAIDIIPTWNHPKNVLGNLYADIYQYDKALSLHESVINRDSSYVWSYNNIGVSMLEMGRLKEAEYYFLKSLQKKKETGKERLNRDWATTYTNLAIITDERGLPQKALQYYNLADSVDASYTESMRNRAALNKSLKQDLSELILKKAIETMPFEAANYYELGEFYRIYNQNKSDLAIADSLFRKAIALNPFNETYYDGLAMLYYDKGEKDSALQLLQNAIEISNTSSDALYNMGYFYNLQSQQDSTLKYYKWALQKNPYNIDYALALADVQLLHKDTIDAEATMLHSQALHPNSPKCFYFVGNFYFKIVQFDKAAKAYESCIEADPSYFKGIQSAAFVYLMNGNYVKSRIKIEQLLQLNEDEEVKLQYMNLVAEAFLKQPIDKRIAWIKPFLPIDPNHELVNELMAETAYETVKYMRSVYIQVKDTEAALEYNNPVLIKWLLLMSIELNETEAMKMYAERYLDETLNTDPVLKAVSFKIMGQLTEARNTKDLIKNIPIPKNATKLLQIFKSI